MARIDTYPPHAALDWMERLPVWQAGTVKGAPLFALGALPSGDVLLNRTAYLADTASTADADPGAGNVRWNNATQASATVIYIADADLAPVNHAALWATVAANGYLYLANKAMTVRQVWQVTAITDAVGYVKLAVTLVASSGSFTDNDPLELSLQQPNETQGTGDVVGPATAVNGNVALFDLTTGKVLKDGGTLGTAAFAASTAFDAAGQAAAAETNAKSYADTLVVGLLDDRGNHGAATNVFPTTGGSGAAGAILKGDLWTISVAGTLGGVAVTAGDVIRALINSPAVAADWVVTENNLGYVPEAAQTAASQVEAEAGTEVAIRKFSPLRIFQAVAAKLTLGTWISGATAKATPVDADSIPLSDSAAANGLKKVTIAALKTIFQPFLVSGTNIKTVNATSLLGSGNITISGGGVTSPKTAFIETTECLSTPITPTTGGPFVVFAGSSGTVTFNQTAYKANSAGYWALNLAAVAKSKASFGSHANNVIVFGEGEAYFAARGELGVLSDASDPFDMEIGFIQSVPSSATSSGAYFTYTHTASGGNWEANTRRNNVMTTTDTGVAAVAGTDMKFEITANAAGTSVEFKINGTIVATHTTNIPTGIYRTGYGVRATRVTSAGTVAKVGFYADYVHVRQTYTSAR